MGATPLLCVDDLNLGHVDVRRCAGSFGRTFWLLMKYENAKRVAYFVR